MSQTASDKPLFLALAFASLAAASFDVWVGTKRSETPKWAFFLLAIVGAVGAASAIFRLASGEARKRSIAVSLLVALLYLYIGFSGASTISSAFSALVVLGIVKFASAIILSSLVFFGR